jgi:hypothetical protein
MMEAKAPQSGTAGDPFPPRKLSFTRRGRAGQASAIYSTVTLFARFLG